MVDHPTAFAWYELLTTDLPAAQSFYSKVVGWNAEDASTPQFAYRLFNAGGAPVAGLMELPLEGRKRGATPRWVGYIAVRNVDGTVDRLKALGGAVYVPPTDSNIGRIAVVADPQTATLALVGGLKYGTATAEADGLGPVSWHELLAGESKAAFGFYSALFGWEKAQAEEALVDTYQLFTSSGRTLGGMFTKFAATPVPFWLYYFEVADLDTAIGEVKAGGGQIAQGPLELWGGSWIARCIDPQGAMFALQGRRRDDATDRSGEGESDAALAWSSSWGGISSRGQLLGKRPRGKGRP
ncbi:VOC family protein [Bradyrhizobium sp. Tv2a-2]|uniref:VOC family protein n=1 Tax=Bradyrhizobium sp. Tv2a-2 TaxID=113395 RepID=UPI00040F85C1|nr:VOC family protein [Bradyrhizobium sp. Tv2a-2]